jgi:hypothetical protein
LVKKKNKIKKLKKGGGLNKGWREVKGLETKSL